MLSIIVPWYNRQELKLALLNLAKSMEEIGGDITIVNLGGDQELLESQVKDWKKFLSIINITSQGNFNKPVAQNIGASYAKFPYLFFCDCDIILPPGILLSLFNKIKENNNVFGTLAGIKETEINSRKANNLILFGYELRLKIADGTEVKIVDNEEDAEVGTRQAPGLLLVKRSDFEKINGYNSQLDGWGWEDQDMICRLTLKGKLTRISWGTAFHISHDDETRMQGYHNYDDRWQSRDKMFRRALANYDQDFFMGSYTKDIKSYKSSILL